MIAYAITGRLEMVGLAGKVYSAKTNHFHHYQKEISIRTDEEVPQHIYVELVGEQAQNFNGKVGQMITLYIRFKNIIDIRGNFYNQIEVWKYDLHQPIEKEGPC